MDRAEAEVPSLNIDPEHLRIIMQGMDEVVNSPRGTARRSAIEDPDRAMGGKTGTAQVRRISKAERDTGVRKSEDMEWRLRDHALFVGYAPVHDPRFVVSVIVDHGGGGSSVAAPIARDVLVETQRLFLDDDTKATTPAETGTDGLDRRTG